MSKMMPRPRKQRKRLDLQSKSRCVALDVSRQILFNLGTPFSHRLLGHLESGDWSSYVNASIDPSSYADAKDFHRDYIALNLLSKFPNFDMGVDREKVALDKFQASERSCSDAAMRLIDLRRGRIKFSDPVFTDVSSARQKIAALLGPFNWDLAEQNFGFGPGASIGLRSRQGDSFYKFGVKPTVIQGSVDLGVLAVSRVPGWKTHLTDNFGPDASDWVTPVRGNNVITVPKNAKTDRVIAIEPLLNMFIQKGIGSVIRRKLKRVGVNLDSQSLNQDLAQAGSSDGSLATIDLSSASDCISLRLVEELLPDDWVEAIKLARSPLGVLPDGTEIRYQKVSSMGNGYTFELESLIFWALLSSVMSNSGELDPRFAVYGDDIVCPVGCAERLIHVLGFVGFKTNNEKTFVHGPFRESCGKHYFHGVDVTPIYIKNSVDTPETKLVLANSIRCLARVHLGLGWGCDSRFFLGWSKVVSSLPPLLRKPRIPFQVSGRRFGDGALVGNFDEVCPRRAPRGFEGYQCSVLGRNYENVTVDGVPLLLKCLHSLEQKKNGLLSLRESAELLRGVKRDIIPLSRYRLRLVKTIAARWEDVGPWEHELLLGD